MQSEGHAAVISDSDQNATEDCFSPRLEIRCSYAPNREYMAQALRVVLGLPKVVLNADVINNEGGNHYKQESAEASIQGEIAQAPLDSNRN